MSDKYTVRHVAALYGVAEETVRLWSKEFKRHLSSSANPGNRRQRFFSDEDMKIFDLVAGLKDDGQTFADIHVALDSGERGGRPETPPNELQALIVNQDEERLIQVNEQLRQKILSLQKDIEHLQEIEHENIRLQTKLESENARAKRAEEQIEELLAERGKLHEELGMLKGELRFLMRQSGISNED